MKEVLVMGLLVIGLYVFARIMLKEPILPWSDKKVNLNVKKSSKGKKNVSGYEETEAEPFKELFSNIKEISHHMIQYHDNKFVMLCEVTPVNYFLLSDVEREAIDYTFETWLATFDYPVQFYLQNRYIDLSEPIEQMRDNMKKSNDLSEDAFDYGNRMIEDLLRWQHVAPRYETKRYIVFYENIKTSEIKADSAEELNDRTIDKAFSELYRRVNAAKSALRKSNMEVHLLTNEGIIEVLYHAFNRQKALKNRFKDIAYQEMLATYVTSDVDERRIEIVKEMIANEFAKKEGQGSTEQQVG